MTVYSHSRLQAFEQCPLKYKLSYIDRIRSGRKTIEAFMGNRFHEAMEHLYGRLSFEKPDLDSLRRIFEGEWERKWSDEVVLVRTDRTADDYRAIGLKALENYFKRHEPFDEGQILGIERDVRADLDGTGRYRVRCIIDRLMRCDDGRIEIHDYKTSAFLPTQADVDGDRQLALYEIAVRQAWPDIEAVDLVWHYVSFDTELRSRRSSEQLEALAERTKSLIDEIETATDYPPKESSLCEWCDHITICPLFAHRFRTEGFGSRDYESDEGQALVNSFAALDAQRQELASRIKGIEAEQERIKGAAVSVAEREGVRRLFGDDHVLNIRDDLKVRYPKKDEIRRQDFEATMRRLGLWEAVSDVSWSSLKTLADHEGWASPGRMPDMLTELVEVEHTKQVRLSRRKDRKGEKED